MRATTKAGVSPTFTSDVVLVIGGFVRGLSMRDVESLCEEAWLGRTSKSTVATICAELRERFGRSVGARSTPAVVFRGWWSAWHHAPIVGAH
jgi:hypothetical protein